MMEGGNKSAEAEGRRRQAESLGWLTESAVMPKKQRYIDGVGTSSIIDLRAQLYKSLEDQRRAADGLSEAPVRKKGGFAAGIFAQKNNGVAERDERDRLELKATQSGANSYAALERKAALYERLKRGEVEDEETLDMYNVDFVRKGMLDEEAKEIERERQGGATTLQGSLPLFVPETKATATAEHKSLVREVNEETQASREKVTALKMRRQQEAEKNRERLKQAFLRKRAQKLKAQQHLQDQSA